MKKRKCRDAVKMTRGVNNYGYWIYAGNMYECDMTTTSIVKANKRKEELITEGYKVRIYNVHDKKVVCKYREY